MPYPDDVMFVVTSYGIGLRIGLIRVMLTVPN